MIDDKDDDDVWTEVDDWMVVCGSDDLDDKNSWTVDKRCTVKKVVLLWHNGVMFVVFS